MTVPRAFEDRLDTADTRMPSIHTLRMPFTIGPAVDWSRGVDDVRWIFCALVYGSCQSLFH